MWLFVSLDPSYQKRIPDLDGGEGCSEYIIHGTNVDISDPSTEAEQQEEERGEQIEGGEASKKEQKKCGEDAAAPDVNNSNAGQAKL